MAREMATVRDGETSAVGLAATIVAFGDDEAVTSDDAPKPLPTGGPRFEPTSVLGEGGMGKVHVALDHQFGREVALKELGEGVRTAEGARRFVVEALVTGNLEHPGIPAVYERGVRDGRPFYAMRKVDGRPMSEAIARAKTLSERLALVPVIVQVANTLGFAHARGVVHRDVKPDNVLLAAHGAVVVVDWGIAKVTGVADVESAISGTPASHAGAQVTVQGAVLGTPAYMAPEQARGDVTAIDARTDVFALGAMLYHVLTGRPPFDGPTSMAALAAALEGQRVPVLKAAPDTPAPLAAVVDKAMAHDPKDRYSNADELAQAIGTFMIAAVTQKPSVIARVVVGVATFAALALLSFATLVSLSVVPGFAQQGGVSSVYATLAVAGLLVTAVEWFTWGRHRLVPLARALAAGTLLAGIGASFSSYVMVAARARDLATEDATANLSAFVAEGIWEASGALALAPMLAALLLVLIAVVARLRPGEKPRKTPT